MTATITNAGHPKKGRLLVPGAPAAGTGDALGLHGELLWVV
jgi:hypothetical protein